MSRELISISSGRGLALLAAVLCCGCDGAISIEGTVVTAPGVEESRVYVDQAAPDLRGMKALDRAIVSIVESPGDNSAARRIDTSSVTGAFTYFAITCPCKFPVELAISRAGYATVTDTFVHRTRDHKVLVVLAPEDR
jgi:hypothetical protein